MRMQLDLLFFIGFVILTGCLACNKINIEDMLVEQPSVVVRERWALDDECIRPTRVAPEPLCPFTVEVYPKNLHFGDPLYVRLNYKNSTDVDAYVFAETDFVAGWTECKTFAFHLRTDDVIIPWYIRSGFGGLCIHGLRRWQRVKPGERGQTQYAAFIPPGAEVAGDLSMHYTGSRLIVGVDSSALPRWSRESWERIGTSPKTGTQLVVVIDNGRTTLMAASSPFDIIPREEEEMQLLRLDSSQEREPFQRQDIERIILKMTPGTLQNLLRYELLLQEWMEPLEVALEEAETSQFHKPFEIDKKLEAHILEFLGKIEDFLKPLHEIEQENLKRIPEQRNYVEMWAYDNEKIRKRVTEVFGDSKSFRWDYEE